MATGNPVNLPQDVGANASAPLTVPVQTPVQAGAYTLQWDMVQSGKTFSQQGAHVRNDSVEVARYAEAISANQLPTTLPPGATLQLIVTAQNKGVLPWPSAGSAAVTLGYHWLDATGKVLGTPQVLSNSVGTLSTNVATGQSVTIPITLHSPALAGSYQLVYDLQQQGTSFASQGATPLTLAMTITPTLPKTYYFAEGYTGTGTSEYLSLTNPTVNQASITVTYLFARGTPLTRTYQMSGQTHTVLSINHEVGANQSVSMIVQSSQPFVAERSIYTHKGSFVAASASVGSSVLSTNWYFAEGNTTSGWNTLLAVLNPSAQSVSIHMNYLLGSHIISRPLTSISVYTIPPHARGTVVLNNAEPIQKFGLAITASSAVMIERPEYLTVSSQRGGNSVVGATGPQTTWYFGGGNTGPGFQENLILADPSATPANVQIRYLSASGQVVNQSVSVPGLSRLAVNVNKLFKQGRHSTVLTSSVPIIAERQDFFSTNVNGRNVLGSTMLMGSSHAYSSWNIAQVDTSSGHAEYLALANPNATSVTVQVVYYLASGTPLIKTYTLAANARTTINLLTDLGPNQAAGATVYATSPIVTEQVMFMNSNGINGGYASNGYGQ